MTETQANSLQAFLSDIAAWALLLGLIPLSLAGFVSVVRSVSRRGLIDRVGWRYVAPKARAEIPELLLLILDEEAYGQDDLRAKAGYRIRSAYVRNGLSVLFRRFLLSPGYLLFFVATGCLIMSTYVAYWFPGRSLSLTDDAIGLVVGLSLVSVLVVLFMGMTTNVNVLNRRLSESYAVLAAVDLLKDCRTTKEWSEPKVAGGINTAVNLKLVRQLVDFEKWWRMHLSRVAKRLDSSTAAWLHGRLNGVVIRIRELEQEALSQGVDAVRIDVVELSRTALRALLLDEFGAISPAESAISADGKEFPRFAVAILGLSVAVGYIVAWAGHWLATDLLRAFLPVMTAVATFSVSMILPRRLLSSFKEPTAFTGR